MVGWQRHQISLFFFFFFIFKYWHLRSNITIDRNVVKEGIWPTQMEIVRWNYYNNKKINKIFEFITRLLGWHLFSLMLFDFALRLLNYWWFAKINNWFSWRIVSVDELSDFFFFFTKCGLNFLVLLTLNLFWGWFTLFAQLEWMIYHSKCKIRWGLHRLLWSVDEMSENFTNFGLILLISLTLIRTLA